MHPIHRTSCQGLQQPQAPCLAEQLAALIDGQTRTDGAAARPSGNALIWVEGEPGLADGQGRGMIVVGHGHDPAAAERSSVISYPLSAAGGRHSLRAVSNALRTMGWSVVAFRRRKTATGCADTAVLANHARSGSKRLMLAEPVQAAQQQPARPMPKLRGHVAPRTRRRRRLGAGDAARMTVGQLVMRVDEGGAGAGATG